MHYQGVLFSSITKIFVAMLHFTKCLPASSQVIAERSKFRAEKFSNIIAKFHIDFLFFSGSLIVKKLFNYVAFVLQDMKN